MISRSIFNKLLKQYTEAGEAELLQLLQQRYGFEKIEEEIRALLQKDPDDLTGRDIKRLKELQQDSNIDVDDFLTRKELSILDSITGGVKKETGKGVFKEGDVPSMLNVSSQNNSLFANPVTFVKAGESQESDEESGELQRIDLELRKEIEEEACRKRIEKFEKDEDDLSGAKLSYLARSMHCSNVTDDTGAGRWKEELNNGVIVIPDGVSRIGDGAFNNCYELTSINIPNSVTSIGSFAFLGCERLTSITIPNSVTIIGGGAFWGCKMLTSITIPNSVTIIGEKAFYECERLTSITIPNSVTSIGRSTFMYCKELTSITIPNSVTIIGEEAFENCERLTSITIPNSVTSIGRSTFRYCSMKKIIVPKGTKQRFKQMEGLKGLESKIVEE